MMLQFRVIRDTFHLSGYHRFTLIWVDDEGYLEGEKTLRTEII